MSRKDLDQLDRVAVAGPLHRPHCHLSTPKSAHELGVTAALEPYRVKSEKVTDLGVRLEQCSVFLRA